MSMVRLSNAMGILKLNVFIFSVFSVKVKETVAAKNDTSFIV